MKIRIFATLNDISGYLGAFLWVFGFIILSPLLVTIAFSAESLVFSDVVPFLVPSAISLVAGFSLKRNFDFTQLDGRRALIAVVVCWVCAAALGGLPFVFALGLGFIDAFFEAMSGLTTTGITLLSELNTLPESILFWRSLSQWLGGLGILTFFMLLVFKGGAAHQLYRAESHKIFSERPAPGMFSTVKILWSIYGLFTGLTAVLLVFEGVSIFDSINHALTTLSTGGFSTHDASIDYFRQAGFIRYRWIEWTLIFSMTLGGISFVVHYRILRGEIKALWSGFEVKLFWKLIGGGCLLVMLSHVVKFGLSDLLDLFRYSLFQTISILTTTGFGTKSISSSFFPALAKQVFLVFMLIGGCVGSTGGGFKVLRIGILGKMLGREVKKSTFPRRSVTSLVVEGESIPEKEISRISSLFFAWLSILVFGAMITALFSKLDTLAAFSGMFSALGNVGPSFISHGEMVNLNPVVKVTFIVGMLAGRLEILPVLLLFRRRAWR